MSKLDKVIEVLEAIQKTNVECLIVCKQVATKNDEVYEESKQYRNTQDNRYIKDLENTVREMGRTQESFNLLLDMVTKLSKTNEEKV